MTLKSKISKTNQFKGGKIYYFYINYKNQKKY